ncbi:hypothetical protein [Isoptericola jiangsuensis]|nr:hypothetical protein [Isoptericola jiangsuensis]
MTMLPPAAARAFWLVLLENAARVVVEADASPRIHTPCGLR